MTAVFNMPTRLYHGPGALDGIATVARDVRIASPLVVTDPIIATTPYFAAALQALRQRCPAVVVFDGCGIDARLSHIDALAGRVRSEGIDGLIAIGGGSVLCTGKGVAAAARLPGSLRGLVDGQDPPPPSVLPMVGVPTTAGSGAEVSQFTVVKDDTPGVAGRKMVFGGAWSFPRAAILDPVVLSTLPRRPAAIAAVDALTHAVEALFSRAATPLTDVMASGALDLLVGAVRRSILDGDQVARADNLLGAAMANVACGNTRLCLAHALSVPLEGTFGVQHGVGVGVLMPHVVRFNGSAVPAKLARIAGSLGVDVDPDPGVTSERVVAAFHDIYTDLGFPLTFDRGAVDRTRLFEIACVASKGLYGEGSETAPTATTLIASPNVRSASVADAVRLYEACLLG